jgi:hypothetical protein
MAEIWVHNNKEFTDPEDWYGFIYEITNNITGKKYIGRKYFTQSKTRQVKGKKKRSRVESDWRNYWGSNKELLADIDKYGKEHFTRNILMLCKSRGNTNYWEAKLQFDNNVLLDDNYYNDWIMIKTHRKHIKK